MPFILATVAFTVIVVLAFPGVTKSVAEEPPAFGYMVQLPDDTMPLMWRAWNCVDLDQLDDLGDRVQLTWFDPVVRDAALDVVEFRRKELVGGR